MSRDWKPLTIKSKKNSDKPWIAAVQYKDDQCVIEGTYEGQKKANYEATDYADMLNQFKDLPEPLRKRMVPMDRLTTL